MPRALLPPLWRELPWPLAHAREIRSELPAGRGQPVVLVPGYVSGDAALGSLAAALRGAGFDARLAGITLNVSCAEAHVERLTDRVARVATERGGRVALVGHSRGGLLARALARRRSDLVSGVVTLASPVCDQLAVHPLLWLHAMTLATLGSLGVPGLLRHACATGPCCRRFRRDLRAALPNDLPFLSLYSRRDGVVDWRACLDPQGDNVEVHTSHCGMPSAAIVQYLIADTLSRLAPPRAVCEPESEHPGINRRRDALHSMSMTNPMTEARGNHDRQASSGSHRSRRRRPFGRLPPS
jgi:pimeloyl-ACP methyl ester carboxylesterase